MLEHERDICLSSQQRGEDQCEVVVTRDDREVACCSRQQEWGHGSSSEERALTEHETCALNLNRRRYNDFLTCFGAR